MSALAKIFMHDGAQAVLLPSEFLLPGTEVMIRRDGNALVLEPFVSTDAISEEALAAMWVEIDAHGLGGPTPPDDSPEPSKG